MIEDVPEYTAFLNGQYTRLTYLEDRPQRMLYSDYLQTAPKSRDIISKGLLTFDAYDKKYKKNEDDNRACIAKRRIDIDHFVLLQSEMLKLESNESSRVSLGYRFLRNHGE